MGELAKAIESYRRAIAANPRLANAHYGLGNALAETADFPGAIAQYRRALAVRPQYPDAYCNLGSALRWNGRLQESLDCYRRGHELGNRQPGWKYKNYSAQWVRQAERWARLGRQLPAFLRGDRKPQGAAECLEVAQLCRYTKHFAASVRFYRVAFAEQPNAEPARRHQAARAAVLAGCGRGVDGDRLPAEEKAGLRGQALAWRRADLERWAQFLDQGTPQARATVQRALGFWLHDGDLAGVRDRAALDKLPQTERVQWAQLWGEVAALLAKADAKK
jgi:tetratricopeptide (TPR) repeat protein